MDTDFSGARKWRSGGGGRRSKKMNSRWVAPAAAAVDRRVIPSTDALDVRHLDEALLGPGRGAIMHASVSPHLFGWCRLVDNASRDAPSPRGYKINGRTTALRAGLVPPARTERRSSSPNGPKANLGLARMPVISERDRSLRSECLI